MSEQINEWMSEWVNGLNVVEMLNYGKAADVDGVTGEAVWRNVKAHKHW